MNDARMKKKMAAPLEERKTREKRPTGRYVRRAFG